MRLALAALLGLAAAPALAQDRPVLFPTRDVAVTYRLLGGQPQGGPQSLTVAWSTAGQLLRTDIPGMGWMVADPRAGRGFMVMEQMRVIIDAPVGQAMQQYGPSPNATFRREGTDTVAGLRCTVWSYQEGANQGRACLTADGVMLRAQGSSQGQSGGMEATGVAFGPQDPQRFQRPQGYGSMQAPQLGTPRR
jgi:hypothetical protein